MLHSGYGLENYPIENWFMQLKYLLVLSTLVN